MPQSYFISLGKWASRALKNVFFFENYGVRGARGAGAQCGPSSCFRQCISQINRRRKLRRRRKPELTPGYQANAVSAGTWGKAAPLSGSSKRRTTILPSLAKHIEYACAPLRGAAPLIICTPGLSVRFAHVDGLGLTHVFVLRRSSSPLCIDGNRNTPPRSRLTH